MNTKLNWKLRYLNKVTLLAIIASVTGCVYQIAGVLGIVVPISEDATVQIVGIIVNLLVTLGVVVDPTTKGIGDSEKAQSYLFPM